MESNYNRYCREHQHRAAQEAGRYLDHLAAKDAAARGRCRSHEDERAQATSRYDHLNHYVRGLEARLEKLERGW